MSRSFTNWSGLVQSTPKNIIEIQTIEDAQNAVSKAKRTKTPITLIGSSHSHSLLVQNSTGIIITTEEMKGSIIINESNMTATIPAGMKLHEVSELLWNKGYALSNQGDVDVQSIAGLIGTGVHGTGLKHPTISSYVQDATLVLNTGDIIKAADNSEILEATRLNLGALGIVMDVTLSVVPTFFLQEQTWKKDMDTVIAEIATLTKENEHFEFFWNPANDKAYIKTLNPHDGPSTQSDEPVQGYVDYSHRVFPSQRNDKHTEMEYSVPYEDGVSCFLDIRDLILSGKHDVLWPVEFRTVDQDTGWISPTKGRKTVTISIHQGIDQLHEPFFREAEMIFRSYSGRPHWGKCNYLTSDDFASMYGVGWKSFWKVQRSLDPDGVFLNSYLRDLRDPQ